MTSPQRNRKAGTSQFPPIQTEALGLSIHPMNTESSPPLATIPAAGVASSQPAKRPSQSREPTWSGGPAQPLQLAQEVHAGANPPSPSHTASPPSAASSFLPQRDPQLQQSPPQLPVQQQSSSQPNNYPRPQNRIPPPTLTQSGPTGVAGLARISDSWVPPDSDLAPDHVARNKKGPLQERDEIHQLDRSADWTGEWIRSMSGDNLADAIAQRTSPTSQLSQQNANRAAASFGPNRTKPRGPTQTSSSPISTMMNNIRQAQQQVLQQSPPNPQPPHLPSASSSQVRNTPPSLQGFIPPNVNPPIPIFTRSQTENAAAAAAAAGVRPIATSPGGGGNYNATRRDTTSPPGAPTRTVTSTSSPSYHTSADSLPGDVRTNYTSAVSSVAGTHSRADSYSAPFEFDRDEDDDIYRHSADPRNRTQREALYRRDGSPSPIPVKAPAAPGNNNLAGAYIRPPIPVRSFPVQEEAEYDDESESDVPQAAQPPLQLQPRWGSQPSHSRERDRRLPTPPPAEPAPHPPIPIVSPKSVQAAHPLLQQQQPHRDSTPSPPVPVAAPGRPSITTQSRPAEEDFEPAEASSENNFTPKSPNVPLPIDHGYTYTNTNVGRYQPRVPDRNGTPGDGYRESYGNLQHALFAMHMGSMPPPRGPLANLQGYANSSFTSLAGAAAALTGKSESPYPPPPPINTNVNGSNASGYGASAESGNVTSTGNYDLPWDGPEHYSYHDFVEYQRRMYANRPGAPVPSTPHSLVSPQNPNNSNHPPPSDNANNAHGFGAPSYGNGYGPGAMLDTSMIPDRYIPSALSSYLSSPMIHNPFLPRFPPPPQSLVSSPSHIPLDLPPAPHTRRPMKKKTQKPLRGSGSGPGSGRGGSNKPSKLGQPPQVAPPPEIPRVGAESTVPKDSSSEESDTDDTKRGSNGPAHKSTPAPGTNGSGRPAETSEDEEEDDDVWLEEDSEDELETEFHSKYIQNPSKRKRKWEQKWDTMVRLFQEIDRTTDSPMILLAAPSTSNPPKTHILISRAILRNPGKFMPHAQTARRSFSAIAKLRRREKDEAAAAERARRSAGFEQQLAHMAFLGSRFEDGSAGSGGRGSSSPGSTVLATSLGALEKLQELPQLAAGGEDGLKQALSVALESLKQMHVIYEQREERWREEAERQRQEAAGLEYLFKAAAFGMDNNPNNSSPASSGGKAPLGKKSP
ncbi:hypothetical protein FRB99_002376 [Tulasnella sp. 403]|nr:hypothetical protein FRB99_002376 [Tulasnella sp. 403]